MDYILLIAGVAIVSFKFWYDMWDMVGDRKGTADYDYLYPLGFSLAVLGIVIATFS